MSPTFIDTPDSLIAFLDGLPECKCQPPSLYVDLEGNNLCRQGTLSIITILVQPQGKTYLIDVTTLGANTFTTKSTNNDSTLKTILEAEDILKVFFDIRNDSDALYSLHGVHVHGIEDLQLFEFASRTFEKRCVHGLAKCIEKDLPLPYPEKQQWQGVKNEGRKLFAPEAGGSYAVFDQRPMTAAMMDYCVQDVVHMPRLRENYLDKLCDAWYVKIKAETEARVRLSHGSNYNGKGRHMALGPTGWGSFRPTLQEKQEKTLFQSSPTKIGPSPSSTTAFTSEPSSETATTPHSTASEEPDTIGEVPAPTILPAQRDSLSARGGRHLYQRGGLSSQRSIRSSPSDDDDDDDDDLSEQDVASMYSRSYREEDEDDSFKDLTACDKECGYCGRCPY